MQQIYEAKVITLTRGDLADGIIFSRKRCILFTIKKSAKILDKRQSYTHRFEAFGAISQICFISLLKKLKAGFPNERKPALSTV